ncbi:hypothetical protein [Fructobacillus fructosus]|uniref:WGR domain-containing protein n=1 Tax=Fructobacillus fructosus TaxID=1631 RepID=A0ABN9YNW5_9LACO|nr:hypothetical protein [Fructobacillus fructosus]MBD9365485.1 hypothetical protein [Leuconostoc mesenteroides]KRN53065.1 hypothetical protein IV71_GL000623 [Fructobacillus fructosus KCTC 3544]MBC9118821.1 hypothetical protein [Fructobacillus fructosus]MCK8638383.1 hypothetical protein [Fructobacillus fructosus]CAK1234770.1 hypothetical protein R54839_PPFHFPJH_00610 [Fructobacillus fructosus]
MVNTKLVADILRLINPLFEKKRNVIYEVRLVIQPFSHELNVFFEWGRIGHATVSRQIKSVQHVTEKQAVQLKEELAKQLGIAVSLMA